MLRFAIVAVLFTLSLEWSSGPALAIDTPLSPSQVKAAISAGNSVGSVIFADAEWQVDSDGGDGISATICTPFLQVAASAAAAKAKYEAVSHSKIAAVVHENAIVVLATLSGDNVDDNDDVAVVVKQGDRVFHASSVQNDLEDPDEHFHRTIEATIPLSRVQASEPFKIVLANVSDFRTTKSELVFDVAPNKMR